MQLTWALYIIAVSLLVGAAAIWVDRIFRHFGRSTRWVWVASLVVSAGLPLAALLFPDLFRSLIVKWLSLWGYPAGPVYAVFTLLREAHWMVSLELPDLRTLALVSWGAALVVASLWLLYSLRDLRRRREQWEEGVVDGRDCLLSRETGPAIVGILRHRLVLPDWILDLPTDRREMVLAHEEEHLRKRDPWLLGVAYATLLVFPWNPVLWWQVRRLRLAVELDCDRRVTGAGRDRASYSELLLDIARSGEPTTVWMTLEVPHREESR